MNLHELTVAQAGPLIRTKEIGIVELTKAFLDRIEQLDPQMNAYATVTAERAMDDARLLAIPLTSQRTVGQICLLRRRGRPPQTLSLRAVYAALAPSCWAS